VIADEAMHAAHPSGSVDRMTFYRIEYSPTESENVGGGIRYHNLSSFRMACTMRLFRRTLLCLVVGVTAFGVAGWVFRPKPNWSIELPGRFHMIVGGAHELSDDEPIWIEGYTVLAAAVRAADGKLLQTLPFANSKDTVANFAALPDGRLAVFPTDEGPVPRQSRCYFYAATQREPLSTVVLDGNWFVADDWLHAWRFVQQGEALVFELRDLQTGNLKRRFPFPDEIRAVGSGTVVDYSPGADLFALSEALRAGSKPPYGIEVRDGATGKLLKTIRSELPDGATGDLFSLYFLFDGKYLNFKSSVPVPSFVRQCTLDVQSGTIRSFDIAHSPTETLEDTDVRILTDQHGRQIWTFKRLEPPAAWVSIVGPDDSSPTWHPLPFPLFIGPKQFSKEGDLPKRHSGVWSNLVPRRAELVVRTTEESLYANLPETVQMLLPATRTPGTSSWRYRWHDWETGEWRLVGCSGGVIDDQVRPSALLTITDIGPQSTLLQSWPLPPRDPKWPALGVAALCTAATWWLCARRFRKRMRLALVGAV
jgi:hypothetical protein